LNNKTGLKTAYLYDAKYFIILNIIMNSQSVENKASWTSSKLKDLPYRFEKLNLTINVIDPKELKELAYYVSKSFFKDEPLSHFYPNDEYEGDMLIKSCSDTRLCLSLRNDSNELVGAFLGSDFQIEQPAEIGDETVLPSNEILDRLEEKYREHYKKENLTGRVVRMYGVHVNPDIRGRSFGGILLHAFAVIAQKQGFTHACGVCTNMFSGKRIKEAGLKPLCSIRYDEYEYQGQKPFKDIDKMFTKEVNTLIGKEKFTTTAAEATLVYASLEEIIKETNPKLIL
jgi:hypothetical protein